MIKVDTERIEIEGRRPEIMAEMVYVIKTVKEHLEEDFGKGRAEEIVRECVELAFADGEELSKRAKKYIAIAKKEMLREN